ncbi:MAG: pitrilysin family protein [Candidatus Eremiobacteraeota bacterium]|nr:pitrilysin family protein [Candidatus Eremiobacteraeota bacterium]
MKHAVRVLVLSLILLFLGDAARGAPAAEKTVKATLRNGLTVIVREDHSAPVAALFVMYRVGSRNEKLGTTGISHLLEHMLFRGTRHYPEGTITRILDVLGAEYNAFTTYDVTGYYETLPVHGLPTALAIEADRMTGTIIDGKALVKEKTVVLSELEGDENSPLEILGNEVQALHFEAHPYMWPVGGFKSDVAGLTKDDVTAYYRTYYSPRNAVLTIVGDVKAKEAQALVERHFGSLPPGPLVPRVRATEPRSMGEKRVTVKKEGTTSYVELAFPAPPVKSGDMHALAVVDAILAGGKSSRLYRALVERGLASSVGASLWENVDPGMYSIVAAVAPGKSPEEVEKAILDALERFQNEPLRPRELEKAVNGVKASFYRARESTTTQAEYLAWYEAIYTYRYFDDFLEGVKRVSEPEVKKAALRYLDPALRSSGLYCARGNIGGQDGTSREGKKHLRYAAHTPLEKSSGQGKALEGSGKHTESKGKFPFSRVVLPNGLVLIVKENHAIPTVTLGGYIRTGSIADPSGKEGLSYLTASMLERGGASGTFHEIADETDLKGISISFQGEREVTRISAWTLKEHLARTVELLSLEVSAPLFPAEEFEKVRHEVEAQLEKQADNPQSQAQIAFRELLYPEGHPYRANVKGYKETLRNITREDLEAFHRTWYRPDRTVIILVGDVTPGEAKALVEKHWGSWNAAGEAPPLSIPSVADPAASRTKVIPMKGKSQVSVVLGSIGLARRSPDYYAFELLNAILGGNTLTSRLGKELRGKRGLVYGVFSFQVEGTGRAPWLVMYGTHEKNVAPSLGAVKKVIEEMQNKPVGDRELQEARSTLVNGFAVALKTNSRMAEVLADIEYFGLGADYVERLPRLYGTISARDLMKVAREYIHLDRSVTVMAGTSKE